MKHEWYVYASASGGSLLHVHNYRVCKWCSCTVQPAVNYYICLGPTPIISLTFYYRTEDLCMMESNEHHFMSSISILNSVFLYGVRIQPIRESI